MGQTSKQRRPGIAIVTGGRGTVEWGGREELGISEGDVLFVGAGEGVELRSVGEEELVVHRAFVEVK